MVNNEFQQLINKGVSAINDYKIINGIITNDFFVEVICGLADLEVMKHFNGDESRTHVLVNPDDPESGTMWTDEAQPIFDSLYDDIQGQVADACNIRLSDDLSEWITRSKND